MSRPRANKSSNRSTITEKKRRHWNAREKLLKVQPGVNRLNTGAKPKYPALETALLTWVKEKRKNQNAVTRSMIQMKAKALAQQRQWQVTCSGVGSFAFSNKWLDGFMRRKNLSNRRCTTVAQHLPDDLVEKQQEFLSYIVYRRVQYDYPLAYIGNIDETPVSFDLPSNTTIDELGTRSVSIRTTGHEKANFTVVLMCMADGTKLPPLIIFKLKNVPRGNFPLEVIIRANQKVDSVKRRFGEKNTNIAVIPEGLTSRLQHLDVSVNKSFKTKMRRNYNEWMAEAVKYVMELKMTGFLTIIDLDKEMPSDNERGNDEEGETDGEYVGKERKRMRNMLMRKGGG
ncbi:unnamed protein product [Rhizophagus irregularis]|nr:unnamed protein product [Rhizophagus irregularis]